MLILGSGERARELAALLELSGDTHVQAFLDDEPLPEDREQLGSRYRGGLSELFRVAAEAPIERVIYALPRRFLATDAIANLVSSCGLLGLDVSFPLDLFETRNGRVVVDHLGSVPAVRLSRCRYPAWKLSIKRALDVLGSLAALTLTSVLWLAAAIAIKLDSPGPVFFVQKRSGRFGRTFTCIKFRTMVQDAEAVQENLRAWNEQSGPVFKMRADPRVTRVGRILRRYSIDELPQLINVLLGHMSLVGPRPPLPSEVARYEIDQRARLSMRPGLTCLWQILGRSEIGFADWVKLDMQYIDNWSLGMDLKILVLTIPAVLSTRGAC